MCYCFPCMLLVVFKLIPGSLIHISTMINEILSISFVELLSELGDGQDKSPLTWLHFNSVFEKFNCIDEGSHQQFWTDREWEDMACTSHTGYDTVCNHLQYIDQIHIVWYAIRLL